MRFWIRSEYHGFNASTDHLMVDFEGEYDSSVMCKCTTSLRTLVDQSPITFNNFSSQGSAQPRLGDTTPLNQKSIVNTQRPTILLFPLPSSESIHYSLLFTSRYLIPSHTYYFCTIYSLFTMAPRVIVVGGGCTQRYTPAPPCPRLIEIQCLA